VSHLIDQRTQIVLGFGQCSSFHLAILAYSGLHEYAERASPNWLFPEQDGIDGLDLVWV